MTRVLLPILLLIAPTVAWSQASDEIIVTGRGLREAIGEDVYDIVILDRERLSGSASNRLDEILKEVPGFQLFRRSDARSANPTNQGATLRALGGNASSRALLILDGVPQTDPFGGWISWPAYDPRRLGEVRVVRGGGSGAYGPGALAGTIDMSSAGPADLAGFATSAGYGSRDAVDLHVGAGMRLGAGFVALSGSHARGHGFVPVIERQRGPVDRASPYRQSSLSARSVAPLANAVELQASGLWFSDERERGTSFSGIATEGADASLRLVGSGDWRWSALAYVQTRSFYNSFASVAADRGLIARASEQYNVPATGVGARGEVRPPLPAGLELRFGADWRETDGETREFYNYQLGSPTRHRVAGGRTETLGAFAEGAAETGPVTLTGGARIDRWKIADGMLQEHLLATGAPLTDAEFTSRSGWQPTGRAGAAVAIGQQLSARAAAYIGWRLPTLNELYRPFRVGTDATAANAELKPERMKGIEAGIDLRPVSSLSLRVTAFLNRLEDPIANVTLGHGPGTFPGVGFVAAGGEYRQRRNLDAIEVKGLEADARLRLAHWSLTAGYSYAHAKVGASGQAALLNGLRPAQTPRHMIATTFAWAGASGARASATMRHVGSQYEDLNQQVLPDAFTIDAAASLPLGRNLAIEARVENLLDEQVVAGISGSGIIERATPRTLWIGLRFGSAGGR